MVASTLQKSFYCFSANKFFLFASRNLDFTDDRVQEGRQYEYRVIAVNAAGPGKPSDTSNAFTAKPMKGNFLHLDFTSKLKNNVSLISLICPTRKTETVLGRIGWQEDQSPCWRTHQYCHSSGWSAHAQG